MIAGILLGLIALGWQGPARPQSVPRTNPSAVKTRAAAEATSHLKQRARQFLETAEAEAAAVSEGGMRSYALLQLARAYASFDRAKTLELLDAAFAAAASLPEESKSKPSLQQQILQATANLSPQRVDELIAEVPANVRQSALLALLTYYQENKQSDRAMDVISRIAAEGSFPFGAASRLMRSLPAESDAERLQLFSAALAGFRGEKAAPEAPVMGDSDFGDMVVKNWQGLPPSLVHDAIDEVLNRAESGDSGSLELTILGPDGSLAFNSAYEWRLFQLLPILRRIDAPAAETLLAKNEPIKQQFQQYPQGVPGWESDSRPAVTGTVVTTRDSKAPRAGPPSVPPHITKMLAMVEQMNRVLAEVHDHPQEALAKAMALPDDTVRLRTLILVARATQKENATVCKSALDKVVEQSDRVPVQEGVTQLIAAGTLYRSLGDKDSIKRVGERGAVLAEKLYKTDTDPDDPNKALKAFWPSTNAWTNFARLVAQASPDAALKMASEVPDDEIRPLIRIVLAASWLGAPSGSSVVMIETKSGTRTLDAPGGD